MSILNMSLFIQDTAAVEGDMGMMWMLISGILVFFMQAGFFLVEAGMTDSKNAVNIAMKNFLDIAVGSLAFWFVGYSLMYGDGNGWFHWSGFVHSAGAADLFFQTVFAATAATIVSGAIAGRTKYTTYAIFSIVLTAIIYPIAGGWEWNGGWLNTMELFQFPYKDYLGKEVLNQYAFIDFAGSSIVHSVGGWAALVAAWMVGPRIGKFLDGKPVELPGHNQMYATLGVFILWLGWFGFNGGSQLAWGGDDATAASQVVLVTNLAAAAGALAALTFTWIFNGKPNLGMTLNGALAGLVSITAGCGNMTEGGAVLAGAIGGILVVLSMGFIEKKLKIDDAVGAISVHGIAGVWGTLVIGLWGVNLEAVVGVDAAGEEITRPVESLFYGGGFAQLGVQAVGVVAYMVWAIALSFIFLYVIKMLFGGLRVTEEEELAGLDIVEHGSIAYPGKRQREME